MERIDNGMETNLPAGIPTQSQYKITTKSEQFHGMEQFSDQFLLQNKDALQEYAQKWVRDPLHQWSRQWEYPFVLDRLIPILETEGEKRILDAGSGVTFFPYSLATQYPNVQISCCDFDESLGSIYQKINETTKKNVAFACGDLHKLSYEEGAFDAVYCISVLEHTENYATIINEFHRILKPGGTLVVTFDLSLDGKRDISPKAGEALLNALLEKFKNSDSVAGDIEKQMQSSEIFTTITASKIDGRLLPWKRPSFTRKIISLLTGRKKTGPPPLTFFCLALQK